VEKGWGLAGSLETEKAVGDRWINILANEEKVRELAGEFGIKTTGCARAKA
jgi:hypothetical protein